MPPPGTTGAWLDSTTGLWWDATAEHWHDSRSGQWVRWVPPQAPTAPPWGAPPPVPGWAPPPARRRPVALAGALALVALALLGGAIYLLTSSDGGGASRAASTPGRSAGPTAGSDTGSGAASSPASGRRPGAWPVDDVPLPLPAEKSELGGPELVDPNNADPNNPDYLTSDLSRGELSYGGLALTVVQQYTQQTIPAAGWKPDGHEKYSDSESWDFTKNHENERMSVTYFTSGTCQIEFERPAPRQRGAEGTAIPTAPAS